MGYSTYKFKYDLFLANIAKNQSDIIKYTTECACLESGDIKGIQSINEAVMDNIKNIIQKIIAAISGIWKKFVERTNELLTTDSAYLEKYKNVILKNPPKSKEITMYQYNLDMLKQITVPEFTYDQKMQAWLATEDAEKTFASTFMSSYKLNENADVKEAVEELIRGANEVDADGKNIDMNKLYQYCSNYKATVELIKKDTDTIMKNQGEVNKILGQLAPKIQAADVAAKKVSTDNTDTKSTENNNQSIDVGPMNNLPGVKTESVVYSNVYEMYISELKIATAKDEPKNSASTTGAKTSGAQVNNGAKPIEKDTVSTISNDIGDKSKEEFDKINTNAPIFFKNCGNILAAKLTVCQEIQKTYMAIIRAHVRDYIGEGK